MLVLFPNCQTFTFEDQIVNTQAKFGMCPVVLFM